MNLHKEVVIRLTCLPSRGTVVNRMVSGIRSAGSGPVWVSTSDQIRGMSRIGPDMF